ncbi:MAG: SDR family NAD(P)-dependent oxidoreductase [Motilibacteraceae bacterium]
MSDPSLDGVALVTGASGGIGRSIAVALAGAGMSVALLGRDRTRLDAALHEAVAAGGRAMAASCDVADWQQVQEAVALVERELGPVDLLVNAAGRIERDDVPVWEADSGEWWEVVEANVRGSFHLVRAVVPDMVARGSGRVVDLSSGIGARDSAGYTAYAASKAALFRLSGGLALAGAEHGVRAFELAPGRVRSAMTAGMPMHADKPEDYWTPVERTTDLVLAIAAGRLDVLSGRFLRADVDDVDTLRAWADWIAQSGTRTLAVRPYGSDDPLTP